MEYTINVRDESFPCIVCGVVLYRVSSDYEGQPDDGVMCSTYGNYGSTVWDPCDGSYLAFNICDPCILEASEKGRLMATRDKRHVKTDESFRIHPVLASDEIRVCRAVPCPVGMRRVTA